ncbi:hypothetical protein HTVC106P_gp49 [Pelagibacter phage HTVC106P]|nr:hypothetical protein HTVC106P_gp49 [Pelagibacter phage HTVC106P]
MAYIGKTPVIGNFVKLDAITAVNGQAAYTMQNGGSNFTDYESVNQFLVSLNGTIQAPTDSFTVSGSTITFASNLSTGDVIDFIMVFGNSLSAGTPTDATVTSAKLSGALVTPSTLDVNGNELILDADADTSITADTDDTIHVKTGGSDRVTVNDTGLAVGTTPEAPLTVGSNNSGQQGVVGKQALFSGTHTSTYNDGNSGSWGGITIVNQDNTSNRTATGITFVNRSTNSGVAGIQSTNDGTEQRADLRFITRGTGDVVAERMRIDDDGNVGIGTSSPSYKFHVVQTAAATAARVHSDTNNSGVLGMSVLAGLDSPSSSGDCKWFRLADGNDSGKAYIQFKSSSPNAEFAAISDERLKTNIQNTDVVGLDVINNLRLVKFDWNETATQDAGWSMTGHQKLGFVAQEVEQILPEFISEDANGFKIMGDSGFIPYLIKAVQEQQTKIKELEARITTLENA